MAKCSTCSAPLEGVVCKYCGTRNEIDLKGIKHVSSRKVNPARHCPVCSFPLVPINISAKSTIYIDRCQSCFGLFFDKGELQVILSLSVEKTSNEIDYKRLRDIIEHPYHRATLAYRRCPVCKEFMQRKNYLRRSGVIIDKCANHGIWLDAGELKRIMEFIRLGGEQLSIENESELTQAYKPVPTKPKQNISLHTPTHFFHNDKKVTVSDVFFETIQDIVRLFD